MPHEAKLTIGSTAVAAVEQPYKGVLLWGDAGCVYHPLVVQPPQPAPTVSLLQPSPKEDTTQHAPVLEAEDADDEDDLFTAVMAT
jgi:hypothetical protein